MTITREDCQVLTVIRLMSDSGGFARSQFMRWFDLELEKAQVLIDYLEQSGLIRRQRPEGSVVSRYFLTDAGYAAARWPDAKTGTIQPRPVIQGPDQSAENQRLKAQNEVLRERVRVLTAANHSLANVKAAA